MSDALLMIFIKNPKPGKAKTRLAATLGDEEALRVYLLLMEHTRNIAFPLGTDVKVFYSDFVDEDDMWDNDRFQKGVQYQGQLGERIQAAFADGFQSGYQRICIIGSDCYALTTGILEEAFDALATNDMVIGPTFDGGYYLLGMNSLFPEAFHNKEWSTASVFEATMADAREHGKQVAVLQKLSDIDHEEDLAKTDIEFKTKD